MSTDKQLLASLTFLERRYTAEVLEEKAAYRQLRKEAIKRGLREENLTPEQQMIRLQLDGPGFVDL